MLARLTLVKDEVQKPVPMFELEPHWSNIVCDSVSLRVIRMTHIS